jgi:hypothetical protein
VFGNIQKGLEIDHTQEIHDNHVIAPLRSRKGDISWNLALQGSLGQGPDWMILPKESQ